MEDIKNAFIKLKNSVLVSTISIISFLAIFFEKFLIDNRNCILLIFMIINIISFIYLLVRIKSNKKIILNISGSRFEIKVGDIFDEKSLKVINFNEYFDTIVDNKIISKNSLNGKFINNYVKNINDLNDTIRNQLKSKEYKLEKNRKVGNNKKYNLGTIVKYNDYLLTSMTHFDNKNQANVSLREYLEFLLNFWDNLNEVYSSESVSITLFGSSSLTRFNDRYDIGEMELIQIIIWTFMISKIKFKYPPSKIALVIDKRSYKNINLNKIKEMYDYGL